MKTYDTMTEQYLNSNGLQRVWLRGSDGQKYLSLKTERQIKDLRARGVTVYDRKT